MIEIKNLIHKYPNTSTPALQNINLHIPPASAIGLLGENGAGKTTLMSLLTGLQAVQSGQILLDGVPFEQLSRAERHQISLVPQDFAFYPLLTVWENLCFFASLYDLNDKAHLEELLEKSGLQAHRKKLAKHLSGGLKRRLNFAIGLINRPKILFLDEITVGIDPVSRQFILNAVKTLIGQGVTVIYTSHYLQEIEQLCERVVLLSQGELLYQGKVQELVREHGSLERFYLAFLDKQAGK
ncbi:ABC transporter ATP-binding protein [Mannheimia sp. E30BD]|uniref:ABC transporter ATP-binding protein n=1 Tax=Mannheimia sp. E30BD TaxID=3278708 RepID=UPI00359CD571